MPKFKLHTGKFYQPMDRHFVEHSGLIKNLYNELTQYVAFSQTAVAELVSMGFTQVISNTLTISQAVSPGHVINTSGSNTITLTDAVNETRLLPRTGSNTLAINQSIVDSEVWRRSNPQTLTFVGTPVVHKIATRTATNTLTLSQSAAVEFIAGSDWFRTIAGSGMIYWAGMLGQQLNFLVLTDDGVSLYTGGTVNTSVSRDNATLFGGGGSIEKKEDGRFIYTIAPDDINGNEMSFIFSNEGAQNREIRLHPVMPPIYDPFESETLVALDSQRTALGGLLWDQHSNTWTRNGSAINPYSGTGKKIATIDTQHANIWGCQVTFQVPDVNNLCIGMKIRATDGDPNGTGFDCFLRNDSSGGSNLEIIKCDDGETMIASGALDPAIRTGYCRLCVRAIGPRITLFFHSTNTSPRFANLEVVSTTHIGNTRHGILINRTDGDTSYDDYWVSDFRFVPYFEG